MAEFFEHGRRELQAGGESGPHPEADELNAYMEGVLSEKERAPLVAHLSRCAACREVVALAAPPVTDAAQAAAGLRDPAVRLALWRWVVVATTAVVVLAAVLFKNDRGVDQYSQPARTIAQAPAKNVPLSPAAGPTANENAPARAKSDSAELAMQSRDKLPTQGRSASPAAEAKKSEPAGAPAPSASPVMATAAAKPQALGGVSPPSSADALDSRARADRAATTLQAANQPAPAPAPQAKDERFTPSAGAVSYEAAEAQSMKMKTARAATMAAPSLAPAVAEYGASPRWSVSEEGAVLRSTDSGRSWQTLQFASGVRFRAVAAVGREIWAGGNGGALFHSADSGKTWTRLPLRVSSDITRIAFSDALHGTVETSAGESWFTSDGGRKWQRR